MRKFSNAVSYLLHPIFLFTYLYLSYWWLYPYPISVNIKGFALVTAIVFFNTAILPVVFLLLGKRSLVDQNLNERRSTIMVVGIIYALSYIFFPERFMPEYLRWVLISIVLGMGIAFLVSLRFKISLHASGWGGFIAVFLYLLLTYGEIFFYPFVTSVILGGLVGMSRLYLGAHTNSELYSGYLSGFVVTALILFNVPTL